MKWTTVLVVTLAMLGGAGNAMADQDTTVEFKGPWSFVFVTNNRAYCRNTADNCVVAISPTHFHKDAQFVGASSTPMKGGVYILTLSGVKDAGQRYQSLLVSTVGNQPIVAGGAAYQDAIEPSNPGKGPKGRYAVILPNAPLSSFEQPAGDDDYTENASITDFFREPDQEFGEDEKAYAKGIKIHYTVTNLKSTLFGRVDGAANDVTYSETAPLKFRVDPLDNPNYFCDFHARQAFRDMNELLNTQPFVYVDFPSYTGSCRQGDPQRYAGKSNSSFAFVYVDSKNINLPATLGLIADLKELNQKLKPNYRGATEREIAALLQQTQEYLQNKPKEHKKEGAELTSKLNNARKILGGVVGSKDKRALVTGVGVLLDIIKMSNDSGANCKAPMLGLTVG